MQRYNRVRKMQRACYINIINSKVSVHLTQLVTSRVELTRH